MSSLLSLMLKRVAALVVCLALGWALMYALTSAVVGMSPVALRRMSLGLLAAWTFTVGLYIVVSFAPLGYRCWHAPMAALMFGLAFAEVDMLLF